mgnify:CR=1 FL=1
MIKKIARYMARKTFCRTAIQQRADLSIFQEKPTLTTIVGLVLIAFSYVIGLPAVIALATIAVWMKKPLIGVIGGPVIYGISMMVFIVGVGLAGTQHFKAVFSWLARIILEKILGDEVAMICSATNTCLESDRSDKQNASIGVIF